MSVMKTSPRFVALVFGVALAIVASSEAEAQTRAGSGTPIGPETETVAYAPSPSVVDTLSVDEATRIVKDTLPSLQWQGYEGEFEKPSDIQVDKRTLTALRKDGRGFRFPLANIRPRVVRCVDQKKGGFMTAAKKTCRDDFAVAGMGDGRVWGDKKREATMRRLVEALLVLKLRSSMQLDPLYQRRFDAAVQMYRAANPKPTLPEDARRFGVQAETLVREKEFTRAADAYEQGLDAVAWWPEGHFNLATVLSSVDRFSEAVVEMKRYLTLTPDALDARAAQDKIYEWELKVPAP
jgi:hypothetical protein